MKIAIISSAEKTIPMSLLGTLDIIITFFIINNITIVTGGCDGILGYLVKNTKNKINTICFSPDIDQNNHQKRQDNLSLEYFSEIKYVEGFTARSLEMIKNTDAVLALNGRIGTLSEITIALEEGKRVGIITETGGICDHMEFILDVAHKEFPNQIFFSPNTQEVLNWLIKKHY